jgi:hypothetical protein
MCFRLPASSCGERNPITAATRVARAIATAYEMRMNSTKNPQYSSDSTPLIDKRQRRLEAFAVVSISAKALLNCQRSVARKDEWRRRESNP